MSSERRYLFVCGCPRSGTTALWRLLISHSEIVLGVERYVWLSFKDGALHPSLFAKERFFDLQKGDTFYGDLVGFNGYYEQAKSNYDQASWVGDKSPPFYKQLNTIEQNFSGAHVVFIVRNIIDVASSYQKRAEDLGDQSWSPDRDFRMAVGDWHDSMRRMLDFLNKPGRSTKITIISYEDIFLRQVDLKPLFDELGVDFKSEVRDSYQSLMNRSRELNLKRGDALTSEQRHYISTNGSFGLYRELLAKRMDFSVI